MDNSDDYIPEPPDGYVTPDPLPHACDPHVMGWEMSPRNGQVFNDKEIADLKAGWEALVHSPDTRIVILAARHQRSESAITLAVQRYRIDPDAPVAGSRWLSQDDVKLQELWGTMDVAALAKEFQRSDLAIRKRAQHLGLPDLPKPTPEPATPSKFREAAALRAQVDALPAKWPSLNPMVARALELYCDGLSLDEIRKVRKVHSRTIARQLDEAQAAFGLPTREALRLLRRP